MTNMLTTVRRMVVGVVAASLALAAGCKKSDSAAVELKVSSYEPTVELYKAINPAFEKFYKAKTGKDIKASTDHGPSGKQARDIAAGKESDVAALSVDYDIDQIVKEGLIDKEWRKRLPNDAVPYYSAVVFMVRKGNPKGIKDWEDLARPDVKSLAPDPKTGGGARWIYLSTWAHALRKARAEGKSDAEAEAAAREFTGKVYDDALLDPAMRQSTTTFVNRKEGDVLFGWENEILQIVNDPRTKADYDVVLPSDSITIEVPIAIVDKVADKHKLREHAEEYVKFLYSEQGQEIVAQYYNRPSNEKVAAKYKDRFPDLKLFKFKDHFSDWPAVMDKHFKTGAILDQVRKK